MLEKYLNQAVLLCFRETAFQAAEGEVILQLIPSHKIIECFLDCSDVPDFKSLEIRQKIKVSLHLARWELRKIEKKEKKIELERESNTGVNEYYITGEIVDIKNKIAVVDCGIYIFIGLELEKLKFKKSDWVETRGRLDTRLVNEGP